MEALRALLQENGIQAKAEGVVKNTIAKALDELNILGERKQSLVEFSQLVLNRKN